MTRTIEIFVKLPASMLVSGAIIEALGARFPTAKMVTQGGPKDFLTVTIDEKDAIAAALSTVKPEDFDEFDPTALREELEAKIGADEQSSPGFKIVADQPDPPGSPDPELFLTQLADGSLGMSTPEWLGKLLVGAFLQVLDGLNAPNYVTFSLIAGDESVYNVILTRPGRPSPHELREAAEARAERLASRLRELGEDPDA